MAALKDDAGHTNSELLAADYVIFGLGRTGLACVRHFTRLGRSVAVIDTRAQPPGLDTLRREFPACPTRLGPPDPHLLAGARKIVVSPGVPLDHPLLRTAAAGAAEIVGDVEIFARHATAPVIAITGSNGKSTVCAMVAQIMRSAGLDAPAGGNFGTPALDLLRHPEPDCYVLELSSFQLEATRSLRPRVACLLNISPDHLDRHGSLAAYATAKARVLHNAAHAVLSADDVLLADLEMPASVAYFTQDPPSARQYGIGADRTGQWLGRGGERIVGVAELGLGATHDLANALAAIAISDFMDIPRSAQVAALRNFRSLPHRCERVLERNGVVWYDDSKGTNVGATAAAVSGIFARRSGVLIAGGQGKGADFAPLAAAVDGRVHTVVLIGEDAPKIAAAVEHVVRVIGAAGMAEAVAIAADRTRPGDAVLLSPACASFDMFAGFEARGAAFVEAVVRLDRS